MVEAGADNLAFEKEESELRIGDTGLNRKLDSSGDEKAANAYAAVSDFHQSSTNTEHTCTTSKRVSLAHASETGDPCIKLYKKRFWMLGLFCVCNMLNGMQWMQYTVVSDVTMCFYDVDLGAVNWTANLYLVLYAPLVFPVSWFTDKMGVKYTVLIGSLLTCVGTAVQCATTTPGTFALVLVSQGLTSVGQVFILALPPIISATWFGADELSRASAVGVFGNQLGCGLGFIFAPLVMSTDCSNKPLITQGKEIVAYTLFSSNVLVFVLLLTTFQEKPEIPPSMAEAKKVVEEKNYRNSVFALITNLNYDLLLIAYGIIVGVYFAVSTILNPIVSMHFPGKYTEIGWMGLIAILSGTVGSIVAGYILDWKHRYKETSLGIFVLSFTFMILFAVLLYVNLLWLQFITISILGFFLTSYLPVGLEFAVEITYPESEAISSQLLNTSTMVVGLVFTIIASELLQRYNDVAANGFLCSMLLLGSILIAVTKCDFRRQKQRENNDHT